MPKVYIVDIKRSPIGKTNGALAHLRPEKMMGQLIKGMPLANTLEIEDVLIAKAVGLGGNLSRLSVLEAGLPIRTPATTIDFQCGGSLKTLEYAFYSIASGHKSAVLAGGVESTSQEARITLNPADPYYHGEVPEKRGQFSPLELGDPDMLEGAENCYRLLKPVAETIEDIVLRSHERAVETRENKALSTLICPMRTQDDKWIESDESIRANMSRKLIRRAKGLVEEAGYTTAANSCLMHDGASLILLASESLVKEKGLRPLAEVIGIESVGLNPNYSPLGPIVACRQLMDKHGVDASDIGVVEVNEAFAIKTWAVEKYLAIDSNRVNPLGGALAYGHPYAASGGIIMGHLLMALKESSEAYGIATMGVAGGQGIAVLVRKIDD